MMRTADFVFDNGLRGILFTPPGSDCSIQFGTKMTSARDGALHIARARSAVQPQRLRRE